MLEKLNLWGLRGADRVIKEDAMDKEVRSRTEGFLFAVRVLYLRLLLCFSAFDVQPEIFLKCFYFSILSFSFCH